MSCKTVEQVREELREISPNLVDKYEIKELEGRNGVELIRGETCIVSHHHSYGGEEGLYEVCPRKNGTSFRRIFGTPEDVVGWLSLEDAVIIAEATEHFPSESLRVIAKKYFGIENPWFDNNLVSCLNFALQEQIERYLTYEDSQRELCSIPGLSLVHEQLLKMFLQKIILNSCGV